MKTISKTLMLSLAIIFWSAVSTSAQITLFEPTDFEAEPTENVIFDAVIEDGATVATLIDPAGNPGARGGTFVLGAPGTAMDIGGVTFQANLAQTFGAGDELTAVIFSGNDFTGADTTNITPAGLGMAPGIDILYEETFPLPTEVPVVNFLVINFASPTTVDSGDQLGVMIFTSTEFSQAEGSNNGGGRLLYRANDGVNGPSGARDFRFSILSPAEGGGLVGDVNCDGDIDLLDVEPFVALLTANEFDAKADINGDGTVDSLDVGPFVDLLTGG